MLTFSDFLKLNFCMKNINELKNKYDQIYLNDNKEYFSKYINGVDISETNRVV